MSAQLALPFFPLLTSSAADFPVRTSAALESELASLVLVAASGLSTVVSSPSYDRPGSWSKMSPAERLRGLTQWSKGWSSKGTCAYRSRLRQLMSERRTREQEFSSLLPTLTRHSYGTNQGGAAGRTGKVRMSLQRMARDGLMPTLTRKGNLLSPSMQKWPAHRRLPTLTKHDEKGASPSEMNRKSPSLSAFATGGHLSPQWCEWFMGFPAGWTELDRASQPSETQSSRSAQR